MCGFGSAPLIPNLSTHWMITPLKQFGEIILAWQVFIINFLSLVDISCLYSKLHCINHSVKRGLNMAVVLFILGTVGQRLLLHRCIVCVCVFVCIMHTKAVCVSLRQPG